jgi:DNA topoisomerase-2
MTIPERTVEDFFDREYRDYAIYTIENRAIPSLIDGFKPSQRKIAFAANKLWKTGKEKPLKVFQLGGQAAAISFFHHGSLDATIIGMAQEFKNSMPIFQGIGQFGTLRSPAAGAARYIGVRFNSNFRLLYQDFELTTPQHEEGEEIEPLYFLPIIPTVLLNGGSGIAVGFATNILNRNPADLIDACIEYLSKGRVQTVLVPWIKGFNGTVELEPGKTKTWVFRGAFEVKNTSTVEVTEIPPGFTYEKYEGHLEKLIEAGKLRSYEDNSSSHAHYKLSFARKVLADLIKRNRLGATLKMREQMTENLTTLDENKDLKVFSDSEELVKHFVDFRLRYYKKRKRLLLKKLDQELLVLDARIRFIMAIVDERIPVRNAKKSELVAGIVAEGLPRVNRSFEYLLSMSIYSLTAEKIADLLKTQEAKKAERAKVEATAPRDFYLSDLKALRKKVVVTRPSVKKPVKGRRASPKSPPVTAPSKKPKAAKGATKVDNDILTWMGVAPQDK